MVLGVTAAAIGTLCVASAGPAFAEKGVHFDPDSPAGKEYALPLEQARDEATGGGNSEGTGGEEGSGESAPLFGEGLSRGPGEVAAGPGRGGTDTGDEPPPGGTGPGADRGTGGIDTGGGTGAAAALGYDDDGYSLLSGALLVSVIVLLGIGLGFGLRGLQRIRPS